MQCVYILLNIYSVYIYILYYIQSMLYSYTHTNIVILECILNPETLANKNTYNNYLFIIKAT
jgi:hypothetical protein